MKRIANSRQAKAERAVQHLIEQLGGCGLPAAIQGKVLQRIAEAGKILYPEYEVSVPEAVLTVGTCAVSLKIQASLTAGICQMDKAFHGALMLSDLPDGTADEMEERISAYVDQEADRVGRWLTQYLCQPPVLWDRAGAAPDRMGFTAAARTKIHGLMEHLWQNMYSQHNAWFLEAVKRDLIERQQPYKDILPDWANAKVHRLKCTCSLISASSDKDVRLSLTLAVKPHNAGVQEKQVSCSLLPMVRIEPVHWSSFLWSAIQSCADAVLQEIPGWLPIWLQCPGGIPPAVKNLYAAPYVQGTVSVSWQGEPLTSRRSIIHLGGNPQNTPSVYLLMDPSGEPIPGSALPYAKLPKQASQPNHWKTIPNNAAFLERLANLLYERLRAGTPKGRKPPKAAILMYPDQPPQLRSGRLSAPLPKPGGKTKDQYVQFLADLILQEREAIEALPNRQKGVLQDLNPTELCLLRILRTGRIIRVEELRDLLENSGMITTVKFAVQCLDGLTKKHVPTAESLAEPLVRGLDRRGSHWQAYTAGAYFAPETLKHIVPRNYSLQELSGIRPSSRAAWAEDWLLRAQAPDLRGPAFAEASKALPRTFLAQFVHTEMGQDFLKLMAPKDIPQAKEILKSLPGCRKLADTLWIPHAPGSAAV